MSENVRHITGAFGQCSRKGCATWTTRIIEVSRDEGGEYRLTKQYHLCGHDSATCDVIINLDLSITLVERHSLSHQQK